MVVIAAVSQNNIIGREGELPWRYPADLRHFKRTTAGHPVVMGRKTFEAIGRPLPNRQNIVLTRNPDYQAPPGVIVFHTLAEARNYCAAAGAAKMFILGGAEIYRLALPQTDEMVLTHIPEHVWGDTTFPPWNPAEWEVVDRREEDGLCFVTYRRK
jgi:dihydrofolate reductase